MKKLINRQHSRRIISGSIAGLFLLLQLPLVVLASPSAFADTVSETGVTAAVEQELLPTTTTESSEESSTELPLVTAEEPIVKDETLQQLLSPTSNESSLENEVANQESTSTQEELSTELTSVNPETQKTETSARVQDDNEPKPAEDKKLTICHRTNSVTNPYVEATVSVNATGDLYDEGNADHRTHEGGIFDPDATYPAPHNGDQWGDIIPDYEYGEDQTYPGLNYDAYGQATLANGCELPEEVTPTGVTKNDPCGRENDTYTIPTTEGVNYQVGGQTVAAGTYNTTVNVTVTAVAQVGYVLAEGVTSTFTLTFTDLSCVLGAAIVTPSVTSTDPCGTDNDTYTIPSTTGVNYQINNVTVAAGTYKGTSNVTVTAVPQTNYEFKPGTATSFPLTFTNVSCGGGIGGDGGQVLGESTVRLFTPQVLGASTQLANTGNPMLANLLAGVFIIGMVGALTATQKRQYS